MLDLYKDKVIMTKHEAWYPKVSVLSWLFFKEKPFEIRNC